jgi:hypothetical protein
LGSVIASLKGQVSEQDLVALLGLHNLGLAVQTNSGFAGPWGNGGDRNVLTNDLYAFLLGKGAGRNFNLIQSPSLQHVSGAPSERQYFSPDPTFDKLQWTRDGGPTQGRIMLNADMGMYHSFQGDQDGLATGSWCRQGNNATLTDCHATNSSFLPLASTAGQCFGYANNQKQYFEEVIPAFIKMTSVLS